MGESSPRELAPAPGGGMAAGVQVDEGWVESNAPAEETFPAELEGHAESLPGGATFVSDRGKLFLTDVSDGVKPF